jgi:hypothetical protein
MENILSLKAEVLRLKDQVMSLEHKLSEAQADVKAYSKLRGAFIELLEQSKEMKERMGIDCPYFEHDWMDKADLL